jgi:hypothetical protein
MEESAERESRRVLRQVQEHLYTAHENLGALREELGLVDVLHHPSNTLPDLNYITPRRKTAWVSGKDVQRGIDYMNQIERTPRIQYIEGLFPPLFARTLIDLGLEAEKETPLMIYMPQGFNGTKPPSPTLPNMPEGIVVERVQDQRGVEMWWYVWRNAHYDVLTLGVEPLIVGRDVAALRMGQQLDIVLHRYNFPVGVARMSVQKETAHLLALALMREVRTPELTRLLQIAAMAAAVERGCELIFAPGESETDRRLCRELGFVDLGSIVCYAAKTGHVAEERDASVVAQPILTFR